MKSLICIILLFKFVLNNYLLEKKAFDFDSSGDSFSLLNKFQCPILSSCLLKCMKNNACRYSKFLNRTCYLYNPYAIEFISSSMLTSNNIYERCCFILNNHLILHMSFNNGIKDIINNNKILDYSNVASVSDRFNNPKKALYFNKNLIKLDEGYYIYDEFTCLIWIKIISLLGKTVVIRFNDALNQFIFYVDQAGKSNHLYIKTSNLVEDQIGFTDFLPVGVWNHIGFGVDKNKNGFVYLNGTLMNQTSFAYTTIMCWRKTNEIGSKIANFEIDDLKIYSRALMQSEILDEFNRNDFLS